MRKWLLSLAVFALASPALAQPVYNPTRMTCAAVQTAIARNGTVILSYTSRRVPGLPVHNRYVDTARQCGSKIMRRTTVPTLNDAACGVMTCDIARSRSRGSR